MTAQLHIQTALRHNKTFLKKAYHTTPFKIADVTEDRSQHTLKLMLMTSSPGILDGDEYNIVIEVATGCSLELQTQSYQRLFNMKKGASQTMDVHLENGSSFCYLPHPTVPHKASDFVAKNKIRLSAGCNLIWGEVLTCGRMLHGEEFAFLKYHNLTEIYLHDRLVVKENLLLTPFASDVTAIGQLEGYTHQASLIYISEAASVNVLVPELHDRLTIENVCFGVSALPVNGVIVRMLGYKAEQLHNLQKKVAEYLMQHGASQIKETAKAVAYAG